MSQADDAVIRMSGLLEIDAMVVRYTAVITAPRDPQGRIRTSDGAADPTARLGHDGQRRQGLPGPSRAGAGDTIDRAGSASRPEPRAGTADPSAWNR